MRGVSYKDDHDYLSDHGVSSEPGDRFDRYKAQRRDRGLPVPTWGEWQAQGQPLYDD